MLWVGRELQEERGGGGSIQVQVEVVGVYLIKGIRHFRPLNASTVGSDVEGLMGGCA